jgi:hypothetical protein
MFGTVRDPTQEHLAATITPPKWRCSSSQNDDIDAGQRAAASDLDQYSRSVLLYEICSTVLDRIY